MRSRSRPSEKFGTHSIKLSKGLPRVALRLGAPFDVPLDALLETRSGASYAAKGAAVLPCHGTQFGSASPRRSDGGVTQEAKSPAPAAKSFANSFVKMRAMRPADAGVPSATTATDKGAAYSLPRTAAACRPTHEAPEAACTIAAKAGESASAQPSAIGPLLEFCGGGTLAAGFALAATRIERPSATGALIAPLAV